MPLLVFQGQVGAGEYLKLLDEGWGAADTGYTFLLALPVLGSGAGILLLSANVQLNLDVAP
jgi:hypothetical protein